MIRKLLWVFVIILVIYIVAVFNLPALAKNIERNLGVSGLSTLVINFKSNLDEMFANLPDREEVETRYTETYSGAIEFKDSVVDSLNYTKSKIDGVRETLSGAEQTVEKTMDFYEENKDKIDDVKKFFKAASGAMEAIDAVENAAGAITSGE